MHGRFRTPEERLNDLERRADAYHVDIERLWRRQRPQGEGWPVGGPWPPTSFTGPWNPPENPCDDCETECFQVVATGFAGDLEQFNGTRCFTRSSSCGWTTSSGDIADLRYMSFTIYPSADPPALGLTLQGQTITYGTTDMDCTVTRTLTAVPAPDSEEPLWPATLDLVPIDCEDCEPGTGTGTSTGTSTLTGTGTAPPTGTGTGTETGTTTTPPPPDCAEFDVTNWVWGGSFPWTVGSGGVCPSSTGCGSCPPDYPGEYVGQIVSTPCAPEPLDCPEGTGTGETTVGPTGTGTSGPTSPPTEGTNTGDPSSTGTGTSGPTSPPTGTGTGGTGTSGPTCYGAVGSSTIVVDGPLVSDTFVWNPTGPQGPAWYSISSVSDWINCTGACTSIEAGSLALWISDNFVECLFPIGPGEWLGGDFNHYVTLPG